MLASPWSPSTSIRSITQKRGESHSQPPLKDRRGCVANRFLESECGGLAPGPSTPSQAPVHSVPTSNVATSEQLSSLNIPQATPPPAAVPLTTSENNAASSTILPGNTASIPAAEPDQRTALDSAVNSNNATPVGFSQASVVLRQSTANSPRSSNNIPDPTNLVSAPDETHPVPNSRGATSPALLAASEDGTLVVMPKTPKTSLSPTSEHAFAVPGTDQTSMPPTMISTTAPAIFTVLGSAHNAHPASQRIGGGRNLNSSHTARGSGGISSVGFMYSGTNGQKSSPAADTTANVTALSRPPVTVSSSSFVANRTTVSVGSTTGTPISSRSSASLFSVETTTNPSVTISSSSSAGGLQFRGAGSRFRDLEMIRLLGCLIVCMIIGARILV